MSVDVDIKLRGVWGTLSEGGSITTISGDKVLNFLQFLAEILKVSLFIDLFQEYRVPSSIDVVNKINGDSHKCTLDWILRKQTITLTGIGVLNEVHLHLALSYDCSVGQLVDGYHAAIDVYVPLCLLAKVNLASLVRDFFSGKYHSHLLNEWAQQMSIESGELVVGCGLGCLSLRHEEHLELLIFC